MGSERMKRALVVGWGLALLAAASSPGAATGVHAAAPEHASTPPQRDLIRSASDGAALPADGHVMQAAAPEHEPTSQERVLARLASGGDARPLWAELGTAGDGAGGLPPRSELGEQFASALASVRGTARIAAHGEADPLAAALDGLA